MADSCIEKCSICLEALERDIASISSCAHQYHSECITHWSKVTNVCPLCKIEFRHIQIGRLRKKVEKKKQQMSEDLADDLNLAAIANAQQQWADNDDDSSFCQICGLSDGSIVIICDGCDDSYHPPCANLRIIPDGDWFCDTCVEQQTSARNGRQRPQNFDDMPDRRRRLRMSLQSPSAGAPQRRSRRRQPTQRNSRSNRGRRSQWIRPSAGISKNEDNPEWGDSAESEDEWVPDALDTDGDDDYDDADDSHSVAHDSDHFFVQDTPLQNRRTRRQRRPNPRYTTDIDLNRFQLSASSASTSTSTTSASQRSNNSRKRKRKTTLEDIAGDRSKRRRMNTNPPSNPTLLSHFSFDNGTNNNNNNNSGKWSCAQCTLANESSATECVVCAEPKPHSSPSPPQMVTRSQTKSFQKRTNTNANNGMDSILSLYSVSPQSKAKRGPTKVSLIDSGDESSDSSKAVNIERRVEPTIQSIQSIKRRPSDASLSQRSSSSTPTLSTTTNELKSNGNANGFQIKLRKNKKANRLPLSAVSDGDKALNQPSSNGSGFDVPTLKEDSFFGRKPRKTLAGFRKKMGNKL